MLGNVGDLIPDHILRDLFLRCFGSGEFRLHIFADDVQSFVIATGAGDTEVHLLRFVALSVLPEQTGCPAKDGIDVAVLAQQVHFGFGQTITPFYDTVSECGWLGVVTGSYVQFLLMTEDCSDIIVWRMNRGDGS